MKTSVCGLIFFGEGAVIENRKCQEMESCPWLVYSN